MSNDLVGRKCHWTSQASGSFKDKQGVILAFIPAKSRPLAIYPDLIDIPNSQVKGDVVVSQSDRYLVRVDRTGAKGQELKPFYYLPRTSGVTIELEFVVEEG